MPRPPHRSGQPSRKPDTNAPGSQPARLDAKRIRRPANRRRAIEKQPPPAQILQAVHIRKTQPSGKLSKSVPSTSFPPRAVFEEWDPDQADQVPSSALFRSQMKCYVKDSGLVAVERQRHCNSAPRSASPLHGPPPVYGFPAYSYDQGKHRRARAAYVYDAAGLLAKNAVPRTAQSYRTIRPAQFTIEPSHTWSSTRTSSTNTNAFEQFTSKERDSETGLDFFEARCYSGAQSRFRSPDPSNLSVDFWVPQSWNRYSYTLNNPLAYVDRNGLWPTWMHNQISNEAFPGLSAQQLKTLRTASYDTDYNNKILGSSPQDPAVSFVHSMSNGTDPDEAHALGLSMRLSDQFIGSNEANARVAQAEWIASGHTGVSPNALTAFGNALHTVTDATSPAHAGFQRWSGAWRPSAASHVAREFRYDPVGNHLTGAERNNAINAVQSAYLNTFGWQLYYQAIGEQPTTPVVKSKINFGPPVDNPDNTQNQ